MSRQKLVSASSKISNAGTSHRVDPCGIRSVVNYNLGVPRTDGRDDTGRKLESGVDMDHLHAGKDLVEMSKVALVR